MKSTLVSLALFFLILSNSLFAQATHSFQVNGGIIMPMNSSRGLAGSLQYNYKLNPTVQLYIYTGYTTWDKFYIKYLTDLQYTGMSLFTSYSANDHKLIPVYAGTRINVRTNKWFTTFLNFEAGYSHLRYNKYNNHFISDPESKVIRGVYAMGPIAKITENLFGLAIGAGIDHPISEKLNLILFYKFHSFANLKSHSFLSTRSTSSSFVAAVEFNI